MAKFLRDLFAVIFSKRQGLQRPPKIFVLSFVCNPSPRMQKSYNIYQNLGYWFLLLIVLVIGGFYSSYFTKLFDDHPPIIHIHFILMMLWIAMLIAQPFMIKFKKLSIHRTLGKVSYVLVPLVLVSAFLMIRLSYYRVIAVAKASALQTLNELTNLQILQQAADIQAIAFFYFLWFLIFYILAVVNRRRSSVHARYMVATALTLLGPTVDRIMFFVFNLEFLPGGISSMWVSFILIDMVLGFLLIKDYKNNRPTKTLWVCLLIYIPGQILHFAVLGNDWWREFMALLMLPRQ